MSGMVHRTTSKNIAYLVKVFPKISETFILQEILELERQGVSLTIYSLYPPTDVEVHPSVAHLHASVHYLNGLSSDVAEESLESHQWLIQHHPQRYARGLKFFQSRKEGMQPGELYHARELAFRLCQDHIDHLHAHFATEPTSVAELAHALTDIPISFTAHAKDIYLSDRDVLRRKMDAASFVTTCTEYNRKFLEEVSSGRTPIHLIYHGLDLKKFQPDSRMDDAQADGTPMILSIGRFREKKGFPTLLQACRLLQEQGINFECRIVGYGPLQSDLERMIEEMGLRDIVTLIGKKSHDEVIDLYRQAMVFVLPCQMGEDGDRDGIPNVLMEAMAMQVPVVTTHISGIPELVRDRMNGLLVDPSDPEGLTSALAGLLNDPGLCGRLGRGGREVVQHQFSATHHVSKIKHLFETVGQNAERSCVSVVGQGVRIF